MTYTRSILKSDFIANLEFFTCFGFIILVDQRNVDPFTLIALGGLFILLIITDIIGGCSTILQPKKLMYRVYFFFRFLVESAKIASLVLLWAFDYLLWDKVENEKNQDKETDYPIFDSLNKF